MRGMGAMVCGGGADGASIGGVDGTCGGVDAVFRAGGDGSTGVVDVGKSTFDPEFEGITITHPARAYPIPTITSEHNNRRMLPPVWIQNSAAGGKIAHHEIFPSAG